jgi:hypothetical protein
MNSGELIKQKLAERGISEDRVRRYLKYREEQDLASGRIRPDWDGKLAVFADEPEVGYVNEEIEAVCAEVGAAYFEKFVAEGEGS